MVARRRALAPSFVASVGIHFGMLAVVAALWVPTVQRTLEHMIPVRLLPVAGDGRSAAPPKPEPRAEASRRPPPPRPAPVVPRPAEPAKRLPEPAAPTPPSEPSPTAVPAPSTLALAPPAESTAQSGAPSDARSGAGAPTESGRGDGVGAGTGGATAPPGYRANPKPDYPPLARQKGYEGTVVLRVRVLPDGTAGDVVVERSSGHDVLDSAAVRAVRAWLFIPATRNGLPVPASVSVPIRFSLAS